MALIFMEHDQHPSMANIIGLYELHSQLQSLTKDQSFEINKDFLTKLQLITTFMCNQDDVQIVKKTEIKWEFVVKECLSVLFQILNERKISFNFEKSSTISEIETITDELIRPALHEHAGNIKILSFQDHILLMELMGSCKGCPFSTQTLTFHIAKIMGMYFPDVMILHIQNPLI